MGLIANSATQKLKVHENGRYLVYEDNSPFFYLGDTAWELLMRLNRTETDHYLQTRKNQGFTVIICAAFGTSLSSETIQNRYGDVPFVDNAVGEKPLTTSGKNPNDSIEYDFWDHADYVINKADELGLYIGFLPFWASYYSTRFSEQSCYLYGEWLGKRYQGKNNIIWIMGGDRPPKKAALDWTFDDIPKYRALAKGIAVGYSGTEDYDAVLQTYHVAGDGNPLSERATNYWLQDEPWMDFNTSQSGHTENREAYILVENNYNDRPIKPTIELEPIYEGIPFEFDIKNERGAAYDLRKAAYWTLFAGAFGFTYGNNNVWQFYSDLFSSNYGANVAWSKVINNESAWQMLYMRNLIESRPFLNRIPDQSIIVGEKGTEGNHMRATRSREGTYLMVYFPTVQQVKIDMEKISGGLINAWWANPRTGRCCDSQGNETHIPFGQYPNIGMHNFIPPATGYDWILVLDDASQGYESPFQVTKNKEQ